jgi:hypothetical protein
MKLIAISTGMVAVQAAGGREWSQRSQAAPSEAGL